MEPTEQELKLRQYLTLLELANQFVNDELGSLVDDEERAIIWMRCMCGMSWDAIADNLGHSRRTVARKWKNIAQKMTSLSQDREDRSPRSQAGPTAT